MVPSLTGGQKIVIFFNRDRQIVPSLNTVKPVLSGHSKIGKTRMFMTNGTLMKVESIAECSPWSILQYF